MHFSRSWKTTKTKNCDLTKMKDFIASSFGLERNEEKERMKDDEWIKILGQQEKVANRRKKMRQKLQENFE